MRQIIGEIEGTAGIGAGGAGGSSMELGQRFLVTRQLAIGPLDAAVVLRVPAG